MAICKWYFFYKVKPTNCNGTSYSFMGLYLHVHKCVEINYMTNQSMHYIIQILSCWMFSAQTHCNKILLIEIFNPIVHFYLQPMDYEGFKLFMSAYLGNNVSEDLCEHLFWAFHKQVAVQSPSLSQTIIDSVAVSVVASNSQQDVNKHDQRRRELIWCTLFLTWCS